MGLSCGAVQPAVGQADAEGSKWVVAETDGGRVRGDHVVLGGSEVIHGDVGLKSHEGKRYAIRQEAAADARLLGVSFQDISRIERGLARRCK